MSSAIVFPPSGGGSGSGAVDSVNGKTGVVVLSKSDVNLTNVDNTSDINKPISTATQTALDGKSDSVHTHVIADVTDLQTSLDGKAQTVHSHTIADITGLQTELDAKASSFTGLIDTPESYTGNEGKLLKVNATADGLVFGDPSGTNVSWGDVSGDLSNQTDLQTSLDGKANSIHTHAIADVTDLQTELDGKSDTTHNHNFDDLLDVDTTGRTDGYVAKYNQTNDKVEFKPINLTATRTPSSILINSDTYGASASILTANGTQAGLSQYSYTSADKAKVDFITVTSPIDLNSIVSNVTTDLSYTASATNGIVVSSDGTDATIPLADSTNAGLMSPSQNDKLASALTSETNTTLSLVANTLTYTDETGTPTNIDLSLYLDDTNLARIISGVYDAPTQSLIFTRDDASTFSVDASMFFDDTNLVTSVNGQTGTVTITIPTNVSEFTNDAGYLTLASIDASDITFDPAVTGVLGSNVQDAIDYVHGAFTSGDKSAVFASVSTESSIALISGNQNFNITSGVDKILFSQLSGTGSLAMTKAGWLGVANTSPTEAIDVAGNAKVSGSVTAGGDVSCGNITTTGNLTVSGNTTLGDTSANTLNVNASTTFANGLTSNAALTVNAATDSTIKNTLQVSDGVSGALIAHNNFYNNRNTANSNVFQTDAKYIAIGQNDNSSVVYMYGDIDVKNGATLKLDGTDITTVFEPVLGNPTSDGYILSSLADGTRSWVALGTPDLTGANTLGADGFSTPQTLLGDTTIGSVTYPSALAVTGNASVAGNTALTGTLTVGGNVTLGNSTATDTTTLISNLDLKGSATLGDSTIDTVTTKGALTVDTNLTVKGNTTLGDTTTDTTTISGGVSVAGSIKQGGYDTTGWSTAWNVFGMGATTSFADYKDATAFSLNAGAYIDGISSLDNSKYKQSNSYASQIHTAYGQINLRVTNDNTKAAGDSITWINALNINASGKATFNNDVAIGGTLTGVTNLTMNGVLSGASFNDGLVITDTGTSGSQDGLSIITKNPSNTTYTSKFRNDAYDNLIIEADVDNNGVDSEIQFNIDGTQQAKIDASGNISATSFTGTGVVTASSLTATGTVGSRNNLITVGGTDCSTANTIITSITVPAGKHLITGMVTVRKNMTTASDGVRYVSIRVSEGGTNTSGILTVGTMRAETYITIPFSGEVGNNYGTAPFSLYVSVAAETTFYVYLSSASNLTGLEYSSRQISYVKIG